MLIKIKWYIHMSLKDLFIIILVVCILGILFFGSVDSFLGHVHNAIGEFTNGTEAKNEYISLDYLEGKTDNTYGHSLGSGFDNSDSNRLNPYSKDSSPEESPEKYDDYQINYTTDMVDEEGNPIILSIVSTSGNQFSPGIYKVYWSKLGVINQTKIK